MTLYEIDKAITDLADPETGEITDFEALDNLQMARDQKIENIACYYKNLVSDAEAIKAEKEALAERQKVAENKAARLKEYLSYALHGEKFSRPDASRHSHSYTKHRNSHSHTTHRHSHSHSSTRDRPHGL